MFDGVGMLILKFRDLAGRRAAATREGKVPSTADEAEWTEVRRQLSRALRDSAAPGGRRSPRVQAALGATLSIDAPGGALEVEEQAGEVTSLNVHGVGLNVAHAPDTGTHVTVRLAPTELTGVALRLRGSVVSVRDGVVGIEFEGLGEADRELLTVLLLEEYLGES